MTKVSLEADLRMEERRKKSRGENLEERQMKRYMRSQKRKARKESQSQIRTTESVSTFTDALESKKIDIQNEKKTELKSEKKTRDVKSKDETGQESIKKKASPENASSKKDKDTKRTSEWVEEMNKINDQKSQEKKKEKKKQKQKQSSSTSNETLASSSPEFSPILYWREPIPDVDILGLETADNVEIGNITTSSKSSEEELKRCLSLDNKTVWFDKSKCEDAETKFQAKKAQETKKSSTKGKKDRTESNPKATDAKQAKTQENTITEMKDYGDKTLEDVLEDFRCDNDRFRTQIIGLSQIIENLQIRIGHLESTPPAEESRKLSESDEGVDMTELAHNKGQINDTNTVISDESCSEININSSLNSGSEFEEFPPIKSRKARDDSPAWAEDWEDLSTSQDLITILKQQNQ